MGKKILAVLLAVAMLVAAAPLAMANTVYTDSTFAETATVQLNDGANIVAVRPDSADVTTEDGGKHVTVTYGEGAVAYFAPADPNIGRTSDGFWIGFNVKIPEGNNIDPNDLDVKYRRTTSWWQDNGVNYATNLEWTNWTAMAWDGDKTYMGCWQMYQPYYFKAGYGNTTDNELYFRYQFDWDNDGHVDQEVVAVVTDEMDYNHMADVGATWNHNGEVAYGFSSLKVAVDTLNANSSGWTITPQKDVTYDTTLTKTALFDLNGKTVTGSLTLDAGSDGQYTVKDSSDGMTGVLTGNLTVTTGTAKITGGRFGGTLSAADGASLVISGGLFTNKPAEAYVAPGMAVVESEDQDYPYTVAELDVIPSVDDPEVELSDELDELSDGDKTAVTAAAGSLALDMTDTDLTDALEELADTVAASKNRYIAAASGLENPENVHLQTYLEVEVTAYDSTANTLTMDITPKAKVIVATTPDKDLLDDTNSVVVDTMVLDVENVTVSVTLPAGFQSQTVYVYHKGRLIGSGAAGVDGSFTFTAPSFSPYMFSISEQRVATVDGLVYASLQDALDDLVNIEATDFPVSMLDAVTEATTFTIPSGFTGDSIIISFPHGQDMSLITVSASSKYTVKKSENIYTVSVKKKPVVTNPDDNNGEEEPGPTPPPAFNQFEDVLKNDWFAPAVGWAVAEGVTSGKTETLFAPYEECTRKEAIAFLWRAAGKPEPNNTNCVFTDVPQDAYYRKAVLWGVENGIVAGMTETTFGPDLTCTRAQVVSFLWRLDGRKLPGDAVNPFTDVQDGEWYRDAVLWAAATGVTNGMTPTTFAPTLKCNRAHVVTFLYNYYMGE